ncbi:MAG: hypothetical protein ACRDO4_06280 [Nocardioides sp.]
MPTIPSIKSGLPSDLKVDLKAAAKPLYAGAGITDLAVELVRDYVTEAQKRFAGAQQRVADIDLDPKARRSAIEKRVAELQADAKTLPAKVQAFLDENLTAVNGTYGDLVNRGESLVTRIRRQESTQSTVTSAKTTTAKAKTTKTQASKAAKSTAKKQSAAPKRSAKATSTAAKKTASSATKAVGDAAAKVGD